MAEPFVWGQGGQQISPSQVKRYGEVAAALAQKAATAPRNLGEGLQAIGNALLYNSYIGKEREGEAAGADNRKAVMDALLGNPDRSTTDIAGALTNPWVADDAGSSAVVQALLGQSLKQDDPAYQLGLKVDQAKLNQLNNPAPVFEGGQWWNTAGGTPEALTQPAPPDPTTLMQNLQAAGLQPGTPEYNQAILDSVTKPGVSVDARQMGSIPPGYQVQYDEQGRPVSMSPIPGSPADLEQRAAAEAAGTRADAQTVNDAEKAATVLDSTKSAIDLLDGSSTPVVGTGSIPFAFSSDTPAGKMRSYVNTLQSGIALGAMMRLKAASAQGATGFGAMNEKELSLLINDIGALDPDKTNPEIFRKTLQRIDGQYRRVISDIKANVSPERIQELGLQPLLESIGSDDGTTKGAAGGPQEGATATNPQTGERLVLRNGQWVPVQ